MRAFRIDGATFSVVSKITRPTYCQSDYRLWESGSKVLDIKLVVVYLRQYRRKYTIMNVKPYPKAKRSKEEVGLRFSPSWVVHHLREAPAYQLELIDRIRMGVKKLEWKQLIKELGATEKEFEPVLPSSISSMQKKAIYDKETSERIYEISRLYGLGYEVFDSPTAFREWLVTPSRPLGNKKPFDLLDSSFGFALVENEIVRIQHNVYS